jgi:hypothetical protein
MRRRQPTPSSCPDDSSDESDSESCFNVEDRVEGTDSDSNLTDVDTDVEEDKDYPLE